MAPREIVTVAKFAAVQPRLVLDLMNAGLDPELRPLIVKGGERFVKALAEGDIASDRDQAERAITCGAKCRSAVKAVSPETVTGWAFNWCGVPLKPLEAGEWAMGNPKADRPEWAGVKWAGVEGPTCGCCLDLKWMVASEACPKGHWGTVRAVLTVRGKAVPAGG